jgi:hypothetical protein
VKKSMLLLLGVLTACGGTTTPEEPEIEPAFVATIVRGSVGSQVAFGFWVYTLPADTVSWKVEQTSFGEVIHPADPMYCFFGEEGTAAPDHSVFISCGVTHRCICSGDMGRSGRCLTACQTSYPPAPSEEYGIRFTAESEKHGTLVVQFPCEDMKDWRCMSER